jgi:hypothetical protein
MILTGAIIVGKDSFPYKLVFTDSNGVIKGYSLTYNEPDETKALVLGRLDRRNRTLTFKETQIVYSHGFHTDAFMCLINATLNYAYDHKGGIIKGTLTSAEADNTACSGGILLFKNTAEINNLFAVREETVKPAAKRDTAVGKARNKKQEAPKNDDDVSITMKKKVRDTTSVKEAPLPAEEPKPLVTEKITAGIEKSYDWISDSLILEIWDGGNLDGDRVTVEFNGTPYLKNYFLIKTRKQLRLPVQEGTNIITVVSDNEGSDPPNTATILLRDGTTLHSVLAYNPKGQKAIIKLLKKAGKK